MNGKRSFTVILILLVSSVAEPATAQEGSGILERVDSVLTAPRDMSATQRLTLIDADGGRKERTLRMHQKGTEMRLAAFLAPADVRNVGFLRVAEDQMYLYLPAFRRVRRIASSIKNESFMGTDLSYEDLSRTRFGDDYAVVAVDSSEAEYRLTLVSRPQADVGYGRIAMSVDRETSVVTGLELFDGRGRLVKTVVASEIQEVAGYWLAGRVEVRSEADGHRTVLELEDIEVDTGLSDDFFSQRQLKRGG